ncbi:MAG TPA: ABC transporter ATP-binding protein [Thermoanaerobaculaceae bacterium]|nr:ABC transporter ATP-binding protein [Thermoanaerobaculaceae bacterium]
MQAGAESSRREAPREAQTALEVSGVSKRYPLFGRRRDRMLALLGRTGRLAYKAALDDVSFAVKRGEALGVVGENGSGKSTLLRLVAGISSPDGGAIRADWPIAAILELGLGFHPEFTGRENAVFYGTLLGLPEEAVRERLPEVLAFAELGDYIDQPLRTYSSGMTSRLAFAVATHVEPRLLVVDEALAVGDGAFQKKCIDRMVRFKAEQRTVVFCSHAMYMVTAFCERALWLHQGRIRMLGPVQDVVEQYEMYLVHRGKRAAGAPDGAGAPPPSGRLGRVSGLRVLDAAGRPATEFAPGSGLEVEIAVESDDPATRLHVGVAIDLADGRCLFGATTHADGRPPLAGSTSYLARLRLPELPVSSGTFHVSAFLFDDHGILTVDQVLMPAAIRVRGERWTPSILHVPHAWSLG